MSNDISDLKKNKIYTCLNKHKHKDIYNSNKLYAISSINNYWKKGSSGTITISFSDPNVSWCHIGTNCNKEKPSMNLGFVDPPIDCFEYNGNVYYPDKDAIRNHYNENDWIAGGTVLHEFCHALGMLHEHQNNLYNSGILLDKEKVINYYKSLGLPKEEAYKNVLDTYNENMLNEYSGTEYDKNSIMSYYLPDEWIKKGHKNPTKPNYELSEKDKEWLEKIYPKNIDKDLWPKLYIKFIDNLNDTEAWKIAWVCKIIQEKIAPLVGIQFIFENGYFEKHEHEHYTKQQTENKEGNTENKENKENKTENEKKNNIVIKNNTINFYGNVYSSSVMITVVLLICSGILYKYKGEFFMK